MLSPRVARLGAARWSARPSAAVEGTGKKGMPLNE
jgi:hypothetical protein